VLDTSVLVLLWGTVLARLPILRRSARQRALWATLFLLALVKTTASPGVQDRLAGAVEHGRLLPHLLAVGCVFFLLRFVSLVTDLYRVRPRAQAVQVGLLCLVLLLLVALAASAPHGIRVRGAPVVTPTDPLSVVAYWVVLEAYLGGILAVATALFWRTGRTAPAGALRVGLRCIAVGLLLNSGYAAHKAVVVVAQAGGVALPTAAAAAVLDAARGLGVLLALAGALAPVAGRLRAAVRAHRSIRALDPLWRLMRTAFPELVLLGRRPAVAERLALHEAHLRLYRRVIEIRDGLLVLRDYLPAEAPAAAAAFLAARGSGAAEHLALAEACCIRLALHRYRTGGRAPGDARWTAVGADLTDEVHWMSRVGACLGRDEPADFVTWWTAPPEGRAPGPPADRGGDCGIASCH